MKKEKLPTPNVNDKYFTEKDMENAFLAGSNKKNWTKVELTEIIDGDNFILQPIFDKWFEKYQQNKQ